MNTIGCGSDRAVGESFASALWALDSLFNMARVGVDGVNIATFPGATFELFDFRQAAGQWQAVVEPEYYGLELFAQAAPAGSRLLKVSPAAAGNLRTYATRAPDGTVRVVAINDTTASRVVRVRVSGASGTGSARAAHRAQPAGDESSDPGRSELRPEHHDGPGSPARQRPTGCHRREVSTWSGCRPRAPRC